MAVKKGVEGMRALVKRYGPRNVFVIGDVMGECHIKKIKIEAEAMMLKIDEEVQTLDPPPSTFDHQP